MMCCSGHWATPLRTCDQLGKECRTTSELEWYVEMMLDGITETRLSDKCQVTLRELLDTAKRARSMR